MSALADAAIGIASKLVEAALVSSDRKDAAAAVILAHLRASPPDVTLPYHEARRAILGDDEGHDRMITWGFKNGATSTSMPGYAELAIDPVTGDLAKPIRIIRGPDAVVQRIRRRFAFFLGEWFLDQRLGVPYFRDVLVKNPNVGLVSSIYRTVLLSTPGVARVPRMQASLDRRTRTLTTTFEAVLEDPNVIVRAVDAAFIIG